MVSKKEKKKKISPIVLVLLLLATGLVIFLICRNIHPKAPEEVKIPAATRAVEEPTVPAVTKVPDVPTTLPVPEETEEESAKPGIVEETRAPLIYDDRVASYSGDNPEWETMHFEWTSQDGSHVISLDIPVDRQMYLYYKGLQRYYTMDSMYLYINDENNREIICSIVDAMRDVANNLSYDDSAVAREIVKFVQDVIEYQYDFDTTGQEEYPRYPIETLYERQGDCEDTSILMAALLKEWGYEVGLLHLPGHAAVAIRTSDTYNATSYYEINGHRYLFIESTGSGWSIGEIPDEFIEAGAEMHIVP